MENNRLAAIISRLETHYDTTFKPVKKKNLLDVLIAVKLSQNTTDKTSHKAYLNLKKNYKDWEEVMLSPLPKIQKDIRICGMAETKSKDIKNMLKEMNTKHGNLSMKHLYKMTDDEIYDELLSYKGIGKKTIACLLAFGMGRSSFPVDTHVHRILNRIGIVDTQTPEKTFEKAKNIIPDDKKIGFHINLIKFGRSICKAPNPVCSECFIYDLCSFKEKIYYKEKLSGEIKENNFIILENI